VVVKGGSDAVPLTPAIRMEVSMRIYRFALIALATVVFSALAARPARAASPWQLCLSLDGAGVGAANVYMLNLNIQGNAILVSGTYGHDDVNNHGPVVGTLSRTLGLVGGFVYQLGLNVMIGNAGDFDEANTENIIFTFGSDGSVHYKRWLSANKPFTVGTAFIFACPNL
jgi:hypothetical protein